MYYIVLSYYYHICYTSSTTLYTDISTVVFSHIVLNDGQWSVGFVLDSNDLTDPSEVNKDIQSFNDVGKRALILIQTLSIQQTRKKEVLKLIEKSSL